LKESALAIYLSEGIETKDLAIADVILCLSLR
jgi:hypothetical protein